MGTLARRGRFGAWRALTALPAIVGSLLLLLVLFGWMGQWEGLVLLAWLGSGAAVLTRVGERAAVALGYGLRRPSRAQRAALDRVWASALARAGIAGSQVDLYVQHSDELNGYAIGGRSVGVTTGLLRELLARRLSTAEVEAVLLHELDTAVVVAVVQAIHQGKPAVAIVFDTVAICAVVCPLADAWISRRSEYAADRLPPNTASARG